MGSVARPTRVVVSPLPDVIGLCGALAGLAGGLAMALVAALVSVTQRQDIWHEAKAIAIVVLGALAAAALGFWDTGGGGACVWAAGLAGRLLRRVAGGRPVALGQLCAGVCGSATTPSTFVGSIMRGKSVIPRPSRTIARIVALSLA